MDEVSKNLHEAMRERGRRRKDEDGWVIERDPKDGATTPGSEYELVEEPRKDV
jgi:glycerol-3-phosphate O-acyltransferase/dihydroxyacetone phosphate acyltransferase